MDQAKDLHSKSSALKALIVHSIRFFKGVKLLGDSFPILLKAIDSSKVGIGTTPNAARLIEVMPRHSLTSLAEKA